MTLYEMIPKSFQILSFISEISIQFLPDMTSFRISVEVQLVETEQDGHHDKILVCYSPNVSITDIGNNWHWNMIAGVMMPIVKQAISGFPLFLLIMRSLYNIIRIIIVFRIMITLLNDHFKHWTWPFKCPCPIVNWINSVVGPFRRNC